MEKEVEEEDKNHCLPVVGNWVLWDTARCCGNRILCVCVRVTLGELILVKMTERP